MKKFILAGIMGFLLTFTTGCVTTQELAEFNGKVLNMTDEAIYMGGELLERFDDTMQELGSRVNKNEYMGKALE